MQRLTRRVSVMKGRITGAGSTW